MIPADQETTVRPWYFQPQAVFFLTTTVLSIVYLIASFQLPIGTIGRIGPAVFPILVGTLGLGASVVGFVGMRKASEPTQASPEDSLQVPGPSADDTAGSGTSDPSAVTEETSNEPARRGFLAVHAKPVIFLILLLVYPLTVDVVGHFPAAFVVCLGVLVIAGRRSALSAVIWALALSAASTFLFASLGVHLPSGVLGFLGRFGL